MLKSFIKFGAFFVLCFFHAFVLSESNKDLHLTYDRHLVKRHDNDLQTCLDNFDVHQDKIIRTQDSRDMGAKYINERDVLSREECLRLCCETESCDVFVFEEKTPGSCYLFECGTPEDFKCKFTKHKNYTSAVLAINRHLTELESQIKFTQHEHELTKLRQPPEPVEVPKEHPPTTESPKIQESLKYGIERPPSQPATTRRGCNRNQFECHTSGECIAIYNACDGIPQCSDGSDEAVELGCPATSTPSLITTTLTSPKAEIKEDHKVVKEQKKDQGETIMSETQKVNPQQPYVPDAPAQGNNFQQNMALPNVPVPNVRAYGREGEGMSNYHPEQQWSNYQYHPNQGGSQIFTHKGNGLVPQSEHYSQHQFVPQDIQQRPVMQQYGEQIPSDYAKYYYDNMAYRMLPQNQAMNSWQPSHKTHEIGQQQVLDDGGLSRLDNIPVANVPGPDYYYEEGYRNRAQPYLPRVPVPQVPHPNVDNKMPETLMETGSDDSSVKHDVPKKKPPTHAPPEVTTLKPKEVTTSHVSHRKVEKVSADVKVKESYLDDEVYGHNTSPSGAVLSLTMGLCITGIMLIFIGCRIKVVRRRMRRGGKSPYAHDADFLVNGMYL